MCEEYPFKILRYHDTVDGVLDNKTDEYLDYGECADQLNHYESIIAEKNLKIESLETENDSLKHHIGELEN